MGRLAYLYNELFEAHKPGNGHPESPQRLTHLNTFLTKQGFFNRAERLDSEAAKLEQLQLIHTKAYIDFVDEYRGTERAVLDGGDTLISAHSVDAALLAAGTGIKAVDLLLDEQYDKVFAAVRPPGHHAQPGSAMGFCVFNNIAVCAAYALSRNVSRILIVDWDVHHGNGTQEAFYGNNQVFYLSLHQAPFYPMTGSASETGKDAGLGYTMNIPIGYGQDDQIYVREFGDALTQIEINFKPELVLVSAGFDAHRDDPIGGMRVSDEGFYKLTEMISRFSQRHANGRIISFLEGGYDLQALSRSVYKHLTCLLKH